MKKSRLEFLEYMRHFLLALVLVFILPAVLSIGSAQAAVVKPEQKIWESILSLDDVSSLSFSGSVTYTGKGSVDFADLLFDPLTLNKKTSAKFETTKIDFEGGNQVFTKYQSQSWFSFSTKSSDKKAPSLDMEIRSIGDKVYLALTGATNMSFEISSFLNTWVLLDFGSLLRDFKLDQLLAEKTGDNNQLDEAGQLREMRDLFLKNKVIAVRSRRVEKINSAYFDVYNIAINKNNLKKFIVASNDLAGRDLLTVRQLANIDKEMPKVKTVTAQIWIGRKDSYPYRIDIDAIGTQAREKTAVRINLKDFNQPISVNEPASFLTLDDLFNRFLTSMPNHIETSIPPTSSLAW